MNRLVRWGFVPAVLLAWEAAARSGAWPDYLLPAPSEVLVTIGAGFADGSYLLGTIVTLRRIMLAFALAVGGGVALGLLAEGVPAVRQAVGPLILGLQALPSVCWFPVAFLWLGIGESAILFVAVAGALFAMAGATESGVRSIPQVYLRAARTMGAAGLSLYVRVVVPAALPALVAGTRQAWSFAWRSLMAGELLFVNLGLGHLLMVGRDLNDMSQVFAVVLLILGLGVAVDRLGFSVAEANIRRRWGLVGRGE